MAVFGPGLTLVGHRGAGRSSARARENTPASFRLAHQLGVPWIELDARQAADGVLVVHHDESLPDGISTAALDSGALKGRGIWTLQEVLETLPPGLGVDVDIKNTVRDALCPADETTAAKVARMVAPVRAERPVLLTSFDPSVAALARAAVPDIAVGLLTWQQVPLRESVPGARHLGFEVVAPFVGVVRNGGPIREHVAAAHEAGLEVLVWVAEAEDLPGLRDLGVDAACVDDVAAARAALER